MKKVLLFLLLPLGALLAFFGVKRVKEPPADYIIKGIVRTMEEDVNPVAKPSECVVITGDQISFVGSFQDAQNNYYQEGKTEIIDCSNNLVIPGFMDAHAHIGIASLASPLADLSGPPYGHVTSIPILQDSMKAYIARNYPPHSNTMVIGNNYDDSQLEGHAQPTKEDLDKIDPDHPIYVAHISGHMGVANSKFLQILNFNDNTPDTVKGGILIKNKGKLTGLLLENVHLYALSVALSLATPPGLTPEQKYQTQLALLKEQEKLWFKYGITTMCEGRANPELIALIRRANQEDKLTGDYIVLPDYDSNADLDQFKDNYNKYDKHFKIGAIKLTLDGSPQGKSAFLSEPYKTPMIGQDSATYHGHPNYNYQTALANVRRVEQAGMPVHIHINGDSAIDMALSIFETLKKEKNAQGEPLIKQQTPNVLIHCQTSRKDQLQKMKNLQPYVMQSFFPTHVYVWGDWYVQNVLGNPRAQYISPLKDADDLLLDFTIHTDAPITPPDLLAGVYGAVNRITQTGNPLGQDQRIRVYRALRAITKDVARQWGEQTTKGKLAIGYKADIIVLDNDIINADPKKIKDAKVLYTFKDGKPVFAMAGRLPPRIPGSK
ncbi:amidohydrolase [Chitinophaga sp. HK235]|uniref:amidohydrolase n=1 Tax=Chitinophaga sp. HK235 TaxID=2952571 RepID=UPI001BAC663A|nr:amidohydrolase family protein [Chitinophaga sp. HK235]